MPRKQTRALDVEPNAANATETVDVDAESLSAEIQDPRTLEISQSYVGRWERLVSTTNWEKGRIIIQWRKALQEGGAPQPAFSDESWSRQVGGVSAQHVGRLRRVYERFGGGYETFSGLYWSHFLAAIDWDDAEMWLEGASQSRWSVSQMRRTRWETLGADPQSEPSALDLVSAADDEDFAPTEAADSIAAARGPSNVSEGPRPDGPDFGDEEPFGAVSPPIAAQDDSAPWDAPNNEPGESPFAGLPKLPLDLADAVEQFKLAIIRHRAAGWSEISQAEVVQSLEALRKFALQ